MALGLTLAISVILFFGSHAGDAFDGAFLPILWIAGGTGAALLLVRRSRFLGIGIVCGTITSFLVQAGALVSFVLVGGS